MLWGQRISKFSTPFEIVKMTTCTCFFVYKKCNLYLVFSNWGCNFHDCFHINPVKGRIVWVIIISIYWCIQTIPIMYERLSNYTITKCGKVSSATCMLSMLADYLWSGILKSANSCIHYIHRKSFWPACPTRYARCHICKVSCSYTEQTKCYVSSSLRMVDPECIAVCPNSQNIFYTFSTWPLSGDDKI